MLRKIILFDYERGLLYRNGRFERVLEPGAHWFFPSSTSIVRLDVRPRTVTVASQEILSADAVALRISVAATYAIADPYISVHASQNTHEALYLAVQLALRDAVSSLPLDQLLAGRQQIGSAVHAQTTPQAAALGLALQSVQIKDITLPGELKRVFAQVVAAQKEGQAALERARGESAALRNLANAARMLDNNPSLLQLRTLLAVSQNAGSSVVFHVPRPSDVTPSE